jgi:DNA-binding NarL/FixJ family response regulator
MTTDELAAGWDALRRGDWREARIRFERAGDAPEALEGLGWASTGLDDHDLIFDARERAYAAYRERGDASSAGRVAAWLAADYLEIRGEPAVASGWLQRAHTHLDDLDPGPDHGWLAVLEADNALTLDGDTETARRLAAGAIDLGRTFGIPELEMVGLGIDGRALVSEGELTTGMRRLDEATAVALAGDAQILVCVGWACCYLIGACEEVRDYDRAGQWCARVGAFAERYGIAVMLGVCRAKYGNVLTSHGRWEEADHELQAAAESLSTSRPAMAGEALVRLAELRRRQGRHTEAEQLFSEHEYDSRALLGRAAVALDLGRPEEAADLADRYLRRFPDIFRIERCAGLELAVRAHAGLAHDDRASQALEELQALATRLGTRPLRGAVLAAEAAVAAARGDHDAARRSFEDAVDTYAACGLPFEAACARLDLAIVLDALGRKDAARRETESALDALRTLGAAHEAARAETLLGRRQDGPFAELSPREVEVLALVAAGLTNAEIASRLLLSEHTVHRHVTNLLRKLGLPSRAAAATLAGRHGLA